MRLRITLAFFLILTFTSYSQVGIGTTSPSPSSILDINSLDKGILVPRLDLENLLTADPVQNPEKSLLVWNTDFSNGGVNEGYFFWNGSQWIKISAEKVRVFADKFNSNDVLVNANSPIAFDILNVSQSIQSEDTYYTVPQTGFYRVNYNLTFEKEGAGGTGNGIYSFYLSTTQNPSGKINGTMVRTEIPNQMSVSNVFLSKMIYLEANDNIYLMSQRKANILSESSFNIEFINE